jgi:phosphate transport system permease protein
MSPETRPGETRDVPSRTHEPARDAMPAPAGAQRPDAPASKGIRRTTSLAVRGEPSLWLTAAGLIGAALMILGLLSLIFVQGFSTFWPKDVVLLTLRSGERLLGEVTREETFRPHVAPAESAGAVDAPARFERRELIRTGNYDLYGDDFKWVTTSSVARTERPKDAVAIERLEWGPFFGFLEEFQDGGKTVAAGREDAWEKFQAEHAPARARLATMRRLEKGRIGDIHHDLEANRLALRGVEIEKGKASPEYAEAAARLARKDEELQASYQELSRQVTALKDEDARHAVVLSEVGGAKKTLKVSEIVRAYRPNDLEASGKLAVYASRWWEFLSQDPREANTEGGIFPAMFGTVLMTMIMALAVAPFGVLAALYLREYARQGVLVSAVRVAVNNLAGVPSIVFGVFGLGFFCYVLGGSIDRLLFPERLPVPTFGTGGVIWAALTLALMTAPVVIVATEEALAAVPRSLREAAYACGSSKWQMIRRVVLPKALPGILTGMILAMSRGAGEVAPLMITGVVKLAHELPIDGHFPYAHLQRSFMHLGFHIYDVGFQSRNAEAGKPMVFTTTLLLIVVILAMNISVIALRARLKRKYAVGHF